MAQEKKATKLTKDIRAALKNTLHQEIEKLPDHLNKLNAKDRLEILIKVLPYILPKVETVGHTINEPNTFGWDME